MSETTKSETPRVETCRCCTCGHEWVMGRDGSHSCAEILQTRFKETDRQLGEAMTENELLRQGPAEAGWWSPETVSAYRLEWEIQTSTLRARLAKAEKDKERLDWLEEQTKESQSGISFDYARLVEDGSVVEKGFRFLKRWFLGDRYPSLRQAIDSAMKGDK